MQLPAFSPKALSRKPAWLKVRAPGGAGYRRLKDTLHQRRLHTVCEEAHCPNIGECWEGGTATFMILGDTCTRGCRFCAVKTARKGLPLDAEEPAHVSESVALMNLDYVVITSVNRDDLSDGGSLHFAKVIKRLRADHPELIIEVLTPDFLGHEEQIARVAAAGPHVFAHNVETVRRLTPKVRDPRASYEQSLAVLDFVGRKFPRIHTKSSLMLGCGELESEVLETMGDLRGVGVGFLTLGQYLRPSPKHMPLTEYVTPEKFDYLRLWGETLGFGVVASGPLVRSSYKAAEFYIKNIIARPKGPKQSPKNLSGDCFGR